MEKPTGRKQHIIPRFYLNYFVHPGWVYLRGSQQPKRVQSAKNVAVIDWYYSQNTNQSSLPLDTLNTRIESGTAPAFRKLLTTNAPLPYAEKYLLSYFIANLCLRSPAHIKETGETMISALEKADEMVRKMTQKEEIEVEEDTPYVKAGSHTYTYKEWKDFLESLRQQNKKGKAMIETTMSLVEYLAPVITEMSWVIQIAPSGTFFVTSDCPVVLTNLEGSRVGAGWANADAVGTLPLSPARYLILFGSPLGKWQFQRTSKEAVKDLNLRTIHFASSAIYSPERYTSAESWLRRKKL